MVFDYEKRCLLVDVNKQEYLKDKGREVIIFLSLEFLVCFYYLHKYIKYCIDRPMFKYEEEENCSLHLNEQDEVAFTRNSL